MCETFFKDLFLMSSLITYIITPSRQPVYQHFSVFFQPLVASVIVRENTINILIKFPGMIHFKSVAQFMNNHTVHNLQRRQQ